MAIAGLGIAPVSGACSDMSGGSSGSTRVAIVPELKKQYFNKSIFFSRLYF